MRLLLLGAFILLCLEVARSEDRTFTHADSLRGTNGPARTCYDVLYYHLDIRVNPETKSISGSNTVTFRVAGDTRRMQFDLAAALRIDSILLDGLHGPSTWTRDGDAFFVNPGLDLAPGSTHALRIVYGGVPREAANPPWSGGMIWKKDAAGNPWVAVTCQGTGASVWWPNKDHQSDEPDSMMISVAVPPGLEDVSNGRLRSIRTLPDGWMRYDWFVSYPINNYNVTVNIGKFAHFSDLYDGKERLTLDYYVMPENEAKARDHFRQVKTMLASYEDWFGPYPFPRDGYKLIESPHLGMEHQSAVAYGNKYVNGYRGRSGSAAGVTFDFIILHESAHEWWGNNVTAADVADMWIHESFGAYAEALYVESTLGREQSLLYINGKKPNVRNDRPIIGTFDVQHEGSGDMYDKGQLVLNTLRTVVNNDILWRETLRMLQEKFRLRSVTGNDIRSAIEAKTGLALGPFFEQYFARPKPPRLELVVSQKGKATSVRYRWRVDAADFRMPVPLVVDGAVRKRLDVTSSWQTEELGECDPAGVRAADDLVYIDVDLRRVHVDPRID